MPTGQCCSAPHTLHDVSVHLTWCLCFQGGEMSEEQYNAMTPEQQAAYWHQWQQYSQQYYATAPDQDHQYAQDPQYQAQYAQYQVRATLRVNGSQAPRDQGV